MPCAHSWHCPWLSCRPGCWGLQPSGCSQCFNSLGTAQPRKRKGSSVLAIKAPPWESPQICDQSQCRDWLISLRPSVDRLVCKNSQTSELPGDCSPWGLQTAKNVKDLSCPAWNIYGASHVETRAGLVPQILLCS